ncbi:MAG TPA: RelA/SpoT family protein [Candidatus Hydrogenedens sp.]|nr:RelA/SpoT family protein [Candidatus Hydrogenedens sp.]
MLEERQLTIPVEVEESFLSLIELLRTNGMGENDIARVQKAFELAVWAHEGQIRASGEPYIKHPIEVARLLGELKLDALTIMGGLLHDVIEDKQVSREFLEEQVGKAVLQIVEGVTKVSRQQMKATVKENEDRRKLETLRKLFITGVKDVRVLLVKLADRLHNMRTLHYLPKENQERIARETLNIYAPIAHRLGIYRWKMELEDLAFKVLLPVEYKCLATRIVRKKEERETEIKNIIANIKSELDRIGIKARILGRPKHLYSTYLKMQRQQIPLEQVMDLYAIRIIVSTIEECYRVLDVAHRLGNIIPERFRDNIRKPRSNGYRSLHTSVFIPDKYPLEIQIRTEEMDQEAELGIAAHWFYKEGGVLDDSLMQRRIEWLRTMVMELSSSDGSSFTTKDIQDELKISEIYVYTPKGDVFELPINATVLDFAYSIHTEVGNHCVGARVNGKNVPINTKLNTGDQVEILTSPRQEPHLDWLKIVTLGKARNKIRHQLREKGILPKEGEEIREEALKKDDKEEHSTQTHVFPDVSSLTKIEYRGGNEEFERGRNLSIRIDGQKNITVQFSRCCNPLPGDDVIGYSTVKGTITVHKKDCRTFNSVPREPSRIHKAHWETDNLTQITVQVTTRPSPTIMQELISLLIERKVSIISARFKTLHSGLLKFEFTQNFISAGNTKAFDSLMRSIRSINGVLQVHRKSVSK